MVELKIRYKNTEIKLPISNNYLQLQRDIKCKNPWLIDHNFVLRYLDDDKTWIDVNNQEDIIIMVAYCTKKIQEKKKYQIRVFVDEDGESGVEYIKQVDEQEEQGGVVDQKENSDRSICGSGGKFSLRNGNNIKYRQTPKLQRQFFYIDEVKVEGLSGPIEDPKKKRKLVLPPKKKPQIQIKINPPSQIKVQETKPQKQAQKTNNNIESQPPTTKNKLPDKPNSSNTKTQAEKNKDKLALPTKVKTKKKNGKSSASSNGQENIKKNVEVKIQVKYEPNQDDSQPEQIDDSSQSLQQQKKSFEKMKVTGAKQLISPNVSLQHLQNSVNGITTIKDNQNTYYSITKENEPPKPQQTKVIIQQNKQQQSQTTHIFEKSKQIISQIKKTQIIQNKNDKTTNKIGQDDDDQQIKSLDNIQQKQKKQIDENIDDDDDEQIKSLDSIQQKQQKQKRQNQQINEKIDDNDNDDDDQQIKSLGSIQQNKQIKQNKQVNESMNESSQSSNIQDSQDDIRQLPDQPVEKLNPVQEYQQSNQSLQQSIKDAQQQIKDDQLQKEDKIQLQREDKIQPQKKDDQLQKKDDFHQKECKNNQQVNQDKKIKIQDQQLSKDIIVEPAKIVHVLKKDEQILNQPQIKQAENKKQLTVDIKQQNSSNIYINLQLQQKSHNEQDSQDQIIQQSQNQQQEISSSFKANTILDNSALDQKQIKIQSEQNSKISRIEKDTSNIISIDQSKPSSNNQNGRQNQADLLAKIKKIEERLERLQKQKEENSEDNEKIFKKYSNKMGLMVCNGCSQPTKFLSKKIIEECNLNIFFCHQCDKKFDIIIKQQNHC